MTTNRRAKGFRCAVPAGILLAVMTLTAWCGSAHAFMGFKSSTESRTPEVPLSAIVRAPRAYKDQTVVFQCRFALQTNLFKAYNTQYDSREFTNFAAWTDDAKLWEKEARRAVVPTFYVKNTDKTLINSLIGFKRYDLLRVTAVVTNDYAGLPWMTVSAIERIDEGADALNDRALKYIQNGRTLEEQSRYAMAADQYLLAADAGIPAMHRDYLFQRIGRNFFLSNDFNKAEAWLLKAVDANPENALALMELAEVSLKLNKPQDALDFTGKALALTADYPELHAIRGEAFGMLGQYEEGLKACEVAINTPGVTPQQRASGEVHRARVLTAAKRYPQAVAAYVRALSEESAYTAAPWLRKEIGQFYETRFLETGQRNLLDEAIREYGNANVISQNRDVDGLYRLANAYYLASVQEKSVDFTKTQELLNQIDVLDPASVDGSLLRGRLHLAKGDLDGARGVLTRLAESHPGNAGVYLALAEVEEKAGNAAGALAAYRNAARAQEHNAAAWRKVADLAERGGDLEQARDAFEHLTLIEPNETWNWYHLARIYLATDAYALAQSSAAKAAVPGAAGNQARLIIAKAAFAEADTLKAEKALGDILATEPVQADAQLLLAQVELEKGTPKAAARALELVITARKVLLDDPIAVDTHAWALHGTGDSGAALAMLEGIPTDRRPRAAWYHLGILLAKQNDLHGARAALVAASSEEAYPGEMKGVATRIAAQAAAMLVNIEAQLHAREEAALMQAEIQTVVEKAIDAALPAPAADTGENAASDVASQPAAGVTVFETHDSVSAEEKKRVVKPDVEEDWQKVKKVEPAEVTSMSPDTMESAETHAHANLIPEIILGAETDGIGATAPVVEPVARIEVGIAHDRADWRDAVLSESDVAVLLPGGEDHGELLEQSAPGGTLAADLVAPDELGFIPMADITIRHTRPSQSALKAGEQSAAKDGSLHYNDVVYDPELYLS